ncbi:thioesterase II family protein [Pseudozobellia sp. WGM2]|uniref:thioesterase II family protein n=1 Tax=Pseudozobellia sp. WGM2 TaxID=2787625 RepID=UPI001ADF9DEA|nr:thioesterase [Pseudozobellia sp. WGM2]
MKIIAFPYAGGNKYSYDFLKPYLKKKMVLEVFENPGRGKRVLEKSLDSIGAIIDDLSIRVIPSIRKNEPYIMYGHSMGALIAFLICKRIQEKRLKLPLKLIVSGKKAPHSPREQKISSYPSAQFWEELTSLGGIPKEVDNEIQLRDFFEPIIKADFRAIEEYSFKKSRQLDIPIDVLYGNEELKNKNDFLDWNRETTNKVTLYPFEGNHFFIHKHAQDIANHLIRGL